MPKEVWYKTRLLHINKYLIPNAGCWGAVYIKQGCHSN